MTRAEEYKRRLIELSGGALNAQHVQDLLGYDSPETVHEAVESRHLLAVKDDEAMLFPVFQFDGRSLRPEIARILAATPHTGGWELLQFLIEGDEGLEPDKPLDLLMGSDTDLERVIRFARTLED